MIINAASKEFVKDTIMKASLKGFYKRDTAAFHAKD